MELTNLNVCNFLSVGFLLQLYLDVLCEGDCGKNDAYNMSFASEMLTFNIVLTKSLLVCVNVMKNETMNFCLVVQRMFGLWGHTHASSLARHLWMYVRGLWTF